MTKRPTQKPEVKASAPAPASPPAAAPVPEDEVPQWVSRLAGSWTWLRGKMLPLERNWRARSWTWLRGKMLHRERNWLGFLATPFGGLTLLSLLLIAVLSWWIGDRAYRNLQLHYQTNMLLAVARADVIADTCRSRSDILWKDCFTPDKRGTPSDRFAWAMLGSAKIVDPLTVSTPDQLDTLKSSDPAAYVVLEWLRGGGESPSYRKRGVELLVAATSICTSGQTGEPHDAKRAIVAAYLADIYQPEAGSTGWLKPELLKAFGWKGRLALQGSSDAGAADSPAADLWIAPSDPRVVFGHLNDGSLLDANRSQLWKILSSGAGTGSGDDEDTLNAFLAESSKRRAVPDTIGDDDIVAYLMGSGKLINADTNSFKDDFSDCNALATRFNDEMEPSQRQAALTNFERFALYVAGQVRTSPEVKRAAFWLSIYTGYEQRLIFMVACFGVLVVTLRMLVFLVPDRVRAGRREPPAEAGHMARATDASLRDNDFDSLSSSRWPVRIAIAVLPAIGFVGTVRGIMLSLSGADEIVWAETVNERSTAISALSADLGLAFATTLLALLAGIALTILTAVEMALGERLLLRRYGSPPLAADPPAPKAAKRG